MAYLADGQWEGGSGWPFPVGRAGVVGGVRRGGARDRAYDVRRGGQVTGRTTCGEAAR
ncbi:hypothetical protein [Streptomyces sp. NBC_01373]|uniref:hypothetical protein n=1 Tax=Streptomyces sp. NBC_01373 TaxID=2903843 RepID=UPI002257E8E5|nr:hypothetical protein [Streptomyces sp. NBC_01373]MCX4701849.1 hypothetical protein [Streptomyces sp. NBC_01373]